MTLGSTMAHVFDGQRPDDPDVYIDKLGNLQYQLKPNDRTELIVRRGIGGGLEVLRYVSGGQPLHLYITHDSKDCVRMIAGYILYGL